jgi:cystathionine beta-lyase
MNFDEIIERRGTNCSKWDKMESIYGVPSKDGIAMWVADMDFRPPESIQQALKNMTDHGVYGYYGDDTSYREAICWWHETRHGWKMDPSWIFSTHGLVNGTAMCVDTFTYPGDRIVLFTPIYHSFFRFLEASGREIIQCPLALDDGRYKLDFDLYDTMMTGNERMLILSSPHNPGGRVWQKEELQGVADFAKRHDLIIISDEIHQDIIYPGHKHTPFALIDETNNNRLIMMSAATKTFNIAGGHTGNVIIPDAKLRATFSKRIAALGVSPNSFGIVMAKAGYSPTGANWLDALMLYLDENRKIFDTAMNSLPGIKSMPLEGTYLAWVDFSSTGMSEKDILARVEKEAIIAVNHGVTFGLGGEGFLRFNLAMPRSVVLRAIERLNDAFCDLQ